MLTGRDEALCSVEMDIASSSRLPMDGALNMLGQGLASGEGEIGMCNKDDGDAALRRIMFTR